MHRAGQEKWVRINEDRDGQLTGEKFQNEKLGAKMWKWKFYSVETWSKIFKMGDRFFVKICIAKII